MTKALGELEFKIDMLTKEEDEPDSFYHGNSHKLYSELHYVYYKTIMQGNFDYIFEYVKKKQMEWVAFFPTKTWL